MNSKAFTVLIFLGFLATSSFSQAPAPAPTMATPPPMMVQPPSPMASPPVPVNEPTPAPTMSPPTMSPTMAPIPQTDAPVSGPSSDAPVSGPSSDAPVSGPSSSLAPGPDGGADAPTGAAWTNKAYFVGTIVAGALYAVVLA